MKGIQIMRVTRYEIFMKVVTLGSLTKAAEYFNYSQSSISQTITSLENELDVTLLNRSHSGAILTEEGKRLLPYIANIVKSHDIFAEEVNALRNLMVGNIRIAAFSSVSCHWLPGCIRKFKSMYPNISFEILQGTYSEIAQWVNNGVVDFGFVSSSKIKGIDYMPLYRDPMLAIVPEDSQLAEKDKLSARELLTRPFIYLTEGEQKIYDNLIHASGIHSRISYYVKDDYTVMSMVENHLGVSVLPELVLRRNPYHIRCLPLDPEQHRYISIAVKDKTRMTISSSRFIDLMRNMIGIQ